MPRRLLLTGGAGFIGSNVVNACLSLLSREDNCLVVVDKMEYCSDLENISEEVRSHPRFFFYPVNINETATIEWMLRHHAITHVLHFAAQSHVDNSFGNSLAFTRDNVLGTHSLLEACKRYGRLERFIHMSTDEVYGEVGMDETSTEHSLLNPTNPYAATKAGAEFLVRSYGHSFKMPWVMIRCNNVYGPNQYPEKLIPRFTVLLAKGKKCTIHGDGQSRRNFIHAADVASAVLCILEKGVLGEIYNISTTNEYSVLEITQRLVRLLRPDVDDWKECVEWVQDRDFNDKRYCIQGDKLRALGWSESIRFEDGFVETVEWYRRRADRWDL